MLPTHAEESPRTDENVVVPVVHERTELIRLPPIDTARTSLWATSENHLVADIPVDTHAPGLLGIDLLSNLACDQRNFYSRDSLTLLGGGFIAGGVIANTSLDDVFQRHLRASILGAESDEWYHTFHASKELGNGMYTLPLMASAWLGGELIDSDDMQIVGAWGERSLRGFAVGAPPVLGLQLLTGGSRPGESAQESTWEPFHDNNGVSGHSFMGALPFITAAKMSEGRSTKMLWYSASLLAPLSRANDNAHYPSQVALGWWIAYLAASAVDSTEHTDGSWTVSPYVSSDMAGVLSEYRF